MFPYLRSRCHHYFAALVITRLGTNSQSLYFAIILWTTLGLSAVRLMGLIYYLFGEWLFRAARLCARGRK